MSRFTTLLPLVPGRVTHACSTWQIRTVASRVQLIVLGMLALLLASCDWIDSTGVQNSGPLLQLEEGQVVELTEGEPSTLDPTVSLDPDRRFGSWRWGAQPTQAGALSACASVNGFRANLAASSVAEACVKASACGIFFEPQTADDGRALFRLVPPTLKAPVGVQYQLIGTDDDGVEKRGNFTFCLIAINEAPDAANDVFTVEFGEALSVTATDANLLSNDTDDIDVGNQPLSVVTPPIREPQFHSSFVLRSDGGFDYVPDADLDFSSGGRITDSFDYEITDGSQTSRATAVINIVGDDQAPTINGPIPEIEVVVGIEPDLSLADYFTDPEGAELTFSALSGFPDAGSLALSAAGMLEGLAARDDVGSWQVVVSAADASNTIDALFTLTVLDNLPVVSLNIPDVEASLGEALRFDTSRFFDDPEDQAIIYSLSGSNELQINRRTGLVSGELDTAGRFELVVSASDGFNIGSRESFTLFVEDAGNRRPVYQGSIPDQSVFLGSGIAIIQGNFSDPDDDVLSYRVIGNLPTGLILNPAGTITGIPSNLGRSAILRLRATDPDGLFVDSDTFRITVTAAPAGTTNRRPTFSGNIADVTVEVDENISVISGQFSDPDNDELNFEVSGNLPDGLEFNVNTGRLFGEPEDVGVFAGLRIVAVDPDGLEASSNVFSITVIDSDEDVDDDVRILEVNGLVALEAERFDSSLAAGDHSWVSFVNPNATEALGVQALPDSGARRTTTAGSPRLSYRVRFNAAGTFYVWVRGLGIRNGNSIHVGLNNNATSTSQNISVPFDWGWSNDRNNGVASVLIPAAGVHTIHVWMREDGVSFDKLVLTRNLAFEPSASGPQETINPGLLVTLL